MNERTRELVEKAGFYSSEYTNADDNFDALVASITRECIAIAQSYDYPNLYGPGTDIANRIYARFKE